MEPPRCAVHYIQCVSSSSGNEPIVHYSRGSYVDTLPRLKVYYDDTMLGEQSCNMSVSSEPQRTHRVWSAVGHMPQDGSTDVEYVEARDLLRSVLRGALQEDYPSTTSGCDPHQVATPPRQRERADVP